jgi:hypothetical protein
MELISYLRRYRLNGDFTNDDISHCLSEIDIYTKHNKDLESSLARDLKPFRSYLLSLRRSRIIDEILK